MNNPHISAVKKKLLHCFSESEITAVAEELGFVIRHRAIEPVDFILSLIASLGSDGRETTLADLHRKFNEMTGLNTTYRSWVNQAKKVSLPHLILWLWVRCLETFSRKVMAFDNQSPFAGFKRILIQDGSSQAVCKALSAALPGRFSAISPAAVELHSMIDLMNDNFVRVQLTEDTRSERACLPELPPSLSAHLILIDAGYFELEYFASVKDRGGHFICRAPQQINPVIHKAVQEDGQTLNRYSGKKLKDVLSRFPKDQCVDLDVIWSQDKHRTYRLVVRWNGNKKKWVFIVTSLDRATFTLSDVLQAYRLRWQIELLFKEVKSYAGWHRFNTKSGTLVVSLILLSFIVATLKRYLAHATEELAEYEISSQKVAKSGTSLFVAVIKAMVRHSRTLPDCLRELIGFWLENAKRSDPVRANSHGRSRLGLCSLGRS